MRMLELVDLRAAEDSSMLPRAGSPRSGLAIANPAISVARPERLFRSVGDTVAFSVPAVEAGARIPVESGLPVLVVKVDASVVEASTERTRTNCLRMTFSV